MSYHHNYLSFALIWDLIKKTKCFQIVRGQAKMLNKTNMNSDPKLKILFLHRLWILKL